MNDIIDILTTFDIKEQKAFHHFLNRQKQMPSRKSLELLKLIDENPNIKPVAIAEKLYKKQNTEAYQAVRKNLKKQLMNYIVLKQFEEGSDAQQTVMGLTGLSRYLFDHQKGARAWKFLLKAENIAIQNDLYDHLELIYMLQIEHAPEQNMLDITQLLEKYKSNQLRADSNRRIAKALSIVKYKLQEVRITGRLIDFNSMLLKVMQDYQLEEDYLSQPKLFYQFMEIFRALAIARKDYYSFEPFLLKNYHLFLQRSKLNARDAVYKAGILYMIAHTFYRNKKFSACMKYLSELNEYIENSPSSLSSKYHIRYLQMFAHSQYYKGNAQAALTLLENTIHCHRKLVNSDRLNIQLSLSFYYFFPGTTFKSKSLAVRNKFQW